MRKAYFLRRGDVKKRGAAWNITVLRQNAPDNGSDAEDSVLLWRDGDRNFVILSSF